MSRLVAYSDSDSESASEDDTSREPVPKDEVTSDAFLEARVSCPLNVLTADLLPADQLLAGSNPDASGAAPLGPPESHQGRKRTFQHVEGNWATTVLIFVKPTAAQGAAVRHLQDAASKLCADNPQSTLRPSDGADAPANKRARVPASEPTDDAYHLSLSRTQPIQHVQKKKLLADLQKALRGTAPFETCFSKLKVFTNDDASRSFLSLSPPPSSVDSIIQVIRRVDSVLLRYRLAPFYADPQPHISLMWWLGDQRAALFNTLGELQRVWDAQCAPWPLQVCEVVCVIGHERHVVWQA